MTIILSKISSIFLIMALGFFINRAKVIPASANKYFVSMLIMVTTPCMIMTSITSKEFNESLLSSTVQVFIFGALFFGSTFVLGYFLCKKIIKVSPSEDLGVYIMAFSTINNGFMGFPITRAIFGNDILYLMVLQNICLNLYMYSAGPFILNINSGKSRFSFRYLLKTLCNPSTIVSVISIIMLFAGLHLPSMLFETVDLIGSTTVPLSMLVVGMQLGDSNFKRLFNNPQLMAMSFVKMLALPILLFLVLNRLPLAPNVKIEIIFGAAFPTAVVSSALAAMENKNSLLAAEAVALTTLMSVAVIPITAVLLTAYYGL